MAVSRTGGLLGLFCDPSGPAGPPSVVATGRESAAFRLWVDDLPEEGNEALMQLRACGFAYDLAQLQQQLLQALRAAPAGPMTRIVGQRVLDLLAAHRGASCFVLEERGGSAR